MSKRLITINDCGCCPYRSCEREYCNALKQSVEEQEDGEIPFWCPLPMIPERRGDFPLPARQEPTKDDWINIGWNACINTINRRIGEDDDSKRTL